MKIDSENYREEVNKLANMTELLTKRLNEITQKISELTAFQLSQDIEACDRILEQMHVARLGFECVRNGNNHRRTSRAFTYTEGKERVYELIRGEIPAYVHLVSVMSTDYVGNHFKAVFASKNPISLEQANRWVENALSGNGNFHFD